MNEIKVNMSNLSNEEREQLMTLVEKANKPKSKVWKPEKYENYYFLSNDGMINMTDWINSSFTSDADRWDIGNVFRTEYEAKEEVNRRKILTKWKRLSIESGEDENEWNGDNYHWSVCCRNEMVVATVLFSDRYEGTYFATKESLLNAISEIGIPNVKKYILGIKE